MSAWAVRFVPRLISRFASDSSSVVNLVWLLNRRGAMWMRCGARSSAEAN